MVTWFDRVYTDPLYLQLYEEDDTRKAPAEVQGLQRLCRPPEDARWLDACCGFGRHAECLADAGLEVVGVDRSVLMLTRARARAVGRVRSPLYVRADIRSLPFADAFDGVSLFFDSFGYFQDDTEHRDALLALALALRPHGQILIQQTNREHLLAHWQPQRDDVHGKIRISRTCRFDLARGRYSWQQTMVGEGTQREWVIDLRLFTASELGALLEATGFDQIRFCGDWDGSIYSVDSPFMIVQARKATFADVPAPP
jgi:SAM-dependent methyltransferase